MLSGGAAGNAARHLKTICDAYLFIAGLNVVLFRWGLRAVFRKVWREKAVFWLKYGKCRV